MRVGKNFYLKNSPIDYNKGVQAYCKRKVSVYGKPNEQSDTYQVGVQVPCSVLSKVPKENYL